MPLPCKRHFSDPCNPARWEQKRVKRLKLKITRAFKSKFTWLWKPTPSKIASYRKLIDPDIDIVLEECRHICYDVRDDDYPLVKTVDVWCREHKIDMKVSYRKIGKDHQSRIVLRFTTNTDLIYFRVGFDA